MSRFSDRAEFEEPPKPMFTGSFSGDADQLLDPPGKPTDDDFVDRQNPVVKSMNDMLKLIDDFKDRVSGFWPKEGLSPEEQRRLIREPFPMGRSLQIPRDSPVSRDDLQGLHYLCKNEQVCADTMLPLANARFANAGYDKLDRQQSVALDRCALRELLTIDADERFSELRLTGEPITQPWMRHKLLAHVQQIVQKGPLNPTDLALLSTVTGLTVPQLLAECREACEGQESLRSLEKVLHSTQTPVNALLRQEAMANKTNWRFS